ncbi:MAG: hypothetical protein ABI192_00560, partial [Bradyrhizobium sp.]
QPDAQKRLHQTETITSVVHTRLSTDHAKLGFNMNRTAVGLSRSSTSFLLKPGEDVGTLDKPGHDELFDRADYLKATT